MKHCAKCGEDIEDGILCAFCREILYVELDK